MKKTLTVILLVLLTLGLFIACNGDVDEKLFSNSYKVQPDGSWKMGGKVYGPSTKPYILVLPIKMNVEKEVQLADLQAGMRTLEEIRSSETPVEIGNATVQLKYDDFGNEYYDYINEGDESKAQNIFMRTTDNDFTETILLNAPYDEFSHYGSLNVATVGEVAQNSYYEYGRVKKVILSIGHLVAKTMSQIDMIFVNTNNPTTVSVDVETKSVKAIIAPEGVAITKPASVPAAKTEDAKFMDEDGKFYKTLAETKGSKVTLLSNATNVDITRSVEIDMFGNELSGKITIAEGKEVTFTDSVGDGSLVNKPEGKGTFEVKDGNYGFDPTEYLKDKENTEANEIKGKSGYYKVAKKSTTPSDGGDSFTVTFNMNGKGTALENQTIAKNGKVVQPKTQTADKFAIFGWYKESTFDTEWNFDTDTVTEDTTLYAKWEEVPPYLCFTAEESGATVALNKNGTPYEIELVYSTDGVNFQDYTIGYPISAPKVGDKVYFKAKNTNANFSKDTSNYYCFDLANDMNCSGNIMYLLDSTGELLTVPANAFTCLFLGTKITTAPELPATTLATSCYSNMFNGTKITTAPELPAETLAELCYDSMFGVCTALTTAPVLPAKTLATNCYSSMFMGCESLVTAPALPAETLATGCYSNMFAYCTALTTAPDLIAESLADSCYYAMFDGCSSLYSVTMLATKNIEATLWFGPEFNYWLSNVASTGTIYVDSTQTGTLTKGSYGIPSDWTVKTPTWSVIGDFGGFNWNKDFMMTETGDNTKVFKSSAITFKAGEQFKVRFGGNWTQNYGAQGVANPYEITLDTPITTLVQDGKNMSVPADGDYIITLNLNGTPTITVTEVVIFDQNPFEPGNIKAGKTLTIKGKNLDHVTKVVFCNNVEVTTFKSQSSEQIVIENFPNKARTGKVTLVYGKTSQEVTSDIDLVVAQPSVSEIYQFTDVKPNQQLNIEGENFDLVSDAIIGNDTCLDFIVSNEGKKITIKMPETVQDSTVKVITASGVEVPVANVIAQVK